MKPIALEQIAIPNQSQKTVFDNAFASPLIRTLTRLRSEMNGNFDETVYSLPMETDWAAVDRFYETELSKQGWNKQSEDQSTVTDVTTRKWERSELFAKQRLILAYIELEAANSERRKFLAVILEK